MSPHPRLIASALLLTTASAGLPRVCLAKGDKGKPAAAAPAAPPARAPAPPPPEPPPPPTLAGTLHALARMYEKKLGRYQALRLEGEFLAARALEGRYAVYGAGDIESVNLTLADMLHRADEAGQGEALNKEIARTFPLLLVANDGNLWHREGTRYVRDFPALSWAVDDVRGSMYATTVGRELLAYDKGQKKFRPTGIVKVRDFQLSAGTLFYVNLDGVLQARSKAGTTRLLQRTVSPDQMVASQGILYLLEAAQLYRWGKGQWDKGGGPIYRGARSVVADGATWYALDAAGHIYAGSAERMIQDADSFGQVWVIGKNLMGLTKRGKVLGYTAATGTWQAL